MSVDAFRRYTPRGAGIYNTTVGYHTVCRECENFNQLVNTAYRRTNRTPEQEELLEKAEKLYRTLSARGLEPKGRYAAVVLGTKLSSNTAQRKSNVDDYLTSILGVSLVDEYKRLLTIPLHAEPDYYQSLLEELRGRCVGSDNRLLPEYVDLFNQVAQRFDDYEDNYEW